MSKQSLCIINRIEIFDNKLAFIIVLCTEKTKDTNFDRRVLCEVFIVTKAFIKINTLCEMLSRTCFIL